MLANEKPKFVLQHYHESWWKVSDQPIWYLGGPTSKDIDPDIDFKAGKWYFTDEEAQFSQPFNTYDACKFALDHYGDYLNLPCQ